MVIVEVDLYRSVRALRKDAIAPNGLSHEFHERDVAYQYWCEGEARIRVKIDHAAFAYGTEWSARDSPVA